MSTLTLIFIAIGLSMDSFAVSISNGLTIKGIRIKHIILIAFSLAFFQAFMPFLGWVSGNGIEDSIKKIDHWIAFILLFIIGGKMIYDSLFNKAEQSTEQPFKIRTLLCQSVATSIDAFAIGISFSFLDINIIEPIIIIGIVTFIFSISGIYLGKKLGKKLGRKAGMIGGIVLINIGLKILIDHLFYL